VYRKKKGFAVPIAQWLRRDPQLVEELLSGASCRELAELNPAGVAALKKQHAEGDNSAAYLLWAVASYVMWRTSAPTQQRSGCEARVRMGA
jgi:asparagine synthase (glutamine-hydrolysing)